MIVATLYYLAPCTQSTSIWSLLPRWLWAAWANGDMGEVAHQQCANWRPVFINYWMSVREYLLINCHFVWGQWLGDWLLTLNAWDLSMVFRFRTRKLCSLGASLLEGHGAVTRDPPTSPWGVYGREVRRATWRQEVFTDGTWPEPRAQHPVSEGR